MELVVGLSMMDGIGRKFKAPKLGERAGSYLRLPGWQEGMLIGRRGWLERNRVWSRLETVRSHSTTLELSVPRTRELRAEHDVNTELQLSSTASAQTYLHSSISQVRHNVCHESLANVPAHPRPAAPGARKCLLLPMRV